MKQTIFENLTLDEERALYGIDGALVKNCRFDGPADGESAMKEARNIEVADCYMNLRYPFWHVQAARITGCQLTEKCRAALWYDKDIVIEKCRLGGIKALPVGDTAGYTVNVHTGVVSYAVGIIAFGGITPAVGRHTQTVHLLQSLIDSGHYPARGAIATGHIYEKYPFTICKYHHSAPSISAMTRSCPFANSRES